MQRYYMQDKNHTCITKLYNHPTSLSQDQSVAIATTNFAMNVELEM